MMKLKHLLLGPAVALALAGCAAVGAIPVVGPILTAPGVESAITALCPSVTGIVIADIQALITANPLIDTNTLANWVCQAFLGGGKQARYRATGVLPTAASVGGVVIHRQSIFYRR